uniref:DUF707 domain-containing protein n=1 Tax=Rhodoblastus sp. TaxID=1962975 RepID=UPI003F9EA1D4
FFTILKSGQFRHADYAWLHLRSRYLAPFALLHYLLAGEASGFRPTPFFDPDFFARHRGDVEGNAFAAFLRRPLGAPACEEFDEAFYAAENSDVAASGQSPWTHCQTHVLSELRDPSPRLSSAFVMMAYNAKPNRRARALMKLFEERRGSRRVALPLLERELKENQARFHAGITMKILVGGPKRKDNLVFVQTDGRHPPQLHDASRNYDLLLNYYAPPKEPPAPAEYVVVQSGTKVTAIDKLLAERPEILTQYDYVLFLDDDIGLSAQDIDRLFSVMRDEKLDLAQPSLTPDSYGSFPALYRKKDSPGFRRVNYVEIMAPAFSRRALIANKDSFSRSISGFSVDALIGAQTTRLFGPTTAVVDSVAAEHKRRIDLDGGALYRFLTAQGIDPRVEMHVLEAQAGLEHGLREV